jgi:hypothetical protein
MADQVLKTVRITDNIKVEVLQQGKKRKYALFYDGNNDYITGRRSGYDDTDKNNNTKSEKYDVAMSDDDVIEMALKAYNGRFGTPQKKFYITQKTYSDPAPARTYGNGDKSPYYLNNGCAVNIQWIGRIPNPEFNPGTYSNLFRAAVAGKKDGKPRYLENSTITSTTDSENKDNFPKSSWSVSPPITDGLPGKEVPTDYRDTSSLQNKIVTVTLPKGFTENGGKGYLVWTEGGLQYDSKSIPEDTPFRRTVDIEGVPVDIGGSKPKNQIVYFDGDKSDQHVLEQVINDFISKITSLHGIFRYDLKLCAPDNETCSLVPYKSPLEPPVKVNDLQTPVETQTPVGASQSTKIKFTIDGLPTEIILKAKEDLDTFTIWAGPIPKINNGDGNIDDFEDGLSQEYKEGESIINEESWTPLNTDIDDSFDSDPDKGLPGPEGTEPPAQQSFVPATQTQKDFIKAAVRATLSQGEKHGKCARYTFNSAKNYVRLMQGKSVEQGAINAAGGNARDSGYHKNLQNMGYKIISNESVSKSSLIDKISSGAWSVGDVIVYWCTDGPPGASYVQYGHTQIFTNGYHNDSSYRWSTDNMNNYKSSFVYRSKSGNSWKLIHLQAPKTKRLNDVA